MELGSKCRLVAGLGNPGKQYDQTRHNVGFLVAEELGRRLGAGFVHERKWDADVAPVGDLLLMKPLTFMNLSGESVGNYCRFYKLDPSEVVVVIDDVALPLGKLRLRRGGSAGGHNGLESVLMHLGTSEVPRVRVGVGGPAGTNLSAHVLGRFAPDERDAAEKAIQRAADAVEHICDRGFEAAMNQFN